jgi:hypothetical protein
VKKFKIGIPTGWKYGKPVNLDLDFMSIKNEVYANYGPVENFNVNIINTPNINLDSTFKAMLKLNRSIKGYIQFQDGAKSIHNREFRWVISSHINVINNAKMKNYVFVTYFDSKTYILTFVSSEQNFEKNKALFEEIAQTFQISL